MRSASDSSNQDLNKQIEILGDTMGVNFDPYPKISVLLTIRKNWYSLIPPNALPPINKQGKLTIEFTIQRTARWRA